jgi:hypothetical protein
VSSVHTRSSRRRRRRTRAAVRWTIRILAVAVVFGAGVALGEALHDNPRPGGTITYVHTFPPGSAP